ncbi:MAG: RsmB/NOP family class I SAM-dependent RNA methyltransferase [Treponema sp.]|nr:RsmB/NOP family class I SAM-dependent RNA methyltransferase [Treponema sp.]
MKQSQKKQKLSGAAGFEQYYSDLFGDRWQSLKAALQTEPDYVAWKAGGAEPYFLDSGSVRAAVTLPLSSAHHILDLCAAPGGKTLVLASCMNEDADLLSNERSADRKNRLVKVCDSCLPEGKRSRITVTCHDGAKMCLSQTECFDAILLDAPCSSERHVLADQKYLAEWSPSRIKTLSVAQWALLSSAWRMLSPGGYLLYSTCALSPEENDMVVARLVKKFSDAQICEPAISSDCTPWCALPSSDLPAYEKTEYGAHVLPDTAGGAGPLYFSLLQKSSKI